MIDLKILRQDPELARASQRAREADPAVVDAILAADVANREALVRFETARSDQKSLGKLVAKAGGEDKAALVARAKALAEEVKQASAALDQAQFDLGQAALALPNLVEPGVPAGGEDKFAVIKQAGRIPDFRAAGFEPKAHDELGESLDIIDSARGAKVSGSRFYYLKGAGARLELALLNHAMDLAIELGFTPMITPTLVRPEVMSGTGFLGEHADEVYYLPADDLYLTGTSEVALAGYHKDEILDLTAGPSRYVGWSACYRREAGSYGKDTKGIFRVHQFHKVEMFTYVRPEDAAHEHQRLLQFEERMLADAALPYRVIDVAAGDLGTSAARKYDCEAWIPSQDRYREMTSTSNCTTFQARRLNIRERTEDGTTRMVATLNGTFATTRWLVAILENHQQADGSVVIPPALRPGMSGLEVIEPDGQRA
ncbi:MAG: serine--tRNA ligase [Bifidobacteriaceae bacterium]|nr:serine--tRNA ligase [Bifidobacteriaceae bacterium]